MREILVQNFEYDLWANQQWLSAIESLPNRQSAIDVMQHVANAQRIWLARCLNEENLPNLPASLGEAFEQLHEQWVELLRICDPTAFIAYETLQGEPCFNMMEDIAMHVINHGTYHRGQLRGMVGDSDQFPETDLIRYLRLRG